MSGHITLSRSLVVVHVDDFDPDLVDYMWGVGWSRFWSQDARCYNVPEDLVTPHHLEQLERMGYPLA